MTPFSTVLFTEGPFFWVPGMSHWMFTIQIQAMEKYLFFSDALDKGRKLGEVKRIRQSRSAVTSEKSKWDQNMERWFRLFHNRKSQVYINASQSPIVANSPLDNNKVLRSSTALAGFTRLLCAVKAVWLLPLRVKEAAAVKAVNAMFEKRQQHFSATCPRTRCLSLSLSLSYLLWKKGHSFTGCLLVKAFLSSSSTRAVVVHAFEQTSETTLT